jgi:hypothetical protein
MSSKTEICNLAIFHLGAVGSIANVDTERSAEALTCRTFYDTVLDLVLRDFPWPFATEYFTLSLVEEEPTDEWGFSYRYPSGCVNFRRIISATRTDDRSTRIPYKIGQDSSGKLIYTDEEDAECEFTKRITDTALYPSDFTMALSYRLAFYIAPKITGADPFKLRDTALKLYQMEIAAAMAAARNEEQPDIEPDSEFISGRDG